MNEPVLFVLAHPDLFASRANKRMAEIAAATDGVRVYDLYAEFPDMFVHGTDARAAFDGVEALVVQNPLYWYAGPGLLKEWFDRTFIAGWAYGRGGKALKGKRYLASVTTGSAADAYRVGGRHGNPVEDYLKPYRQIAEFCQMRWQDPLVLHHARSISDDELDQHAQLLKQRLETLAAGSASR